MGHFLSVLLDESPERFSLIDEHTARVVATRLEPAFDSRSRRRGLLGRSGLETGAALILAPCNSVHTFFMRFPIDILFVRRDGTVLKALSRVGPWRAAVSFRAFAVIELPAGTAQEIGLKAEDRLRIDMHRPTPTAESASDKTRV